MIYMILFVKQKQRHKCREQIYGYQEGKRVVVEGTGRLGWTHIYYSCCCHSVAQSCLTLCNPMDCSTPGFLSFIISQIHYLNRFVSVELVMPSNHLILCHPFLLLLSVFPSIRVFSNELTLCIRWPKDWSFSFSICPSNEYSQSVSFPYSFLVVIWNNKICTVCLDTHPLPKGDASLYLNNELFEK